MTREMHDYACELMEIGGVIYGSFPDLPGSSFEATSRSSIGAVAHDAFETWLATAEAQGFPVPEPGSADKMTGTLRMRVPKLLHRQLLHLCNVHEVSLSTLVSSLLSVGANWMSKECSAFQCPGLEDTPPEVKLGTGRFSRYDVSTATGSWTQSVRKSLHFHLSWLAEREEVSLNLLCATLIARATFGGNITRERSTTYLRAANGGKGPLINQGPFHNLNELRPSDSQNR